MISITKNLPEEKALERLKQLEDKWKAGTEGKVPPGKKYKIGNYPEAPEETKHTPPAEPITKDLSSFMSGKALHKMNKQLTEYTEG